MRLAAIAADEIIQFVHVEHGETRRADRGEVAAAALDRHDATRLAGQRIGKSNFELFPPPKFVMRRSAPSRFER